MTPPAPDTDRNLLFGVLALQAEDERRAALAIRKHLVADFLTVPTYRRDLAGSHHNLALLLSATGHPREAEVGYRAALAINQQLAADFPTRPEYQNAVAATLVDMAGLPLARKDFLNARQLLETALPHHLAALKATPAIPSTGLTLAKVMAGSFMGHGCCRRMRTL